MKLIHKMINRLYAWTTGINYMMFGPDDILPKPDLRRCERNGSVEYFIRASRGVTIQ
jgi:hypothetical protein